MALGITKISNGEFTTNINDWSQSGTSTLAWVSGELEVNMIGAYTGASQQVTLEIGKTYRISVDGRIANGGDYAIGLNNGGWAILQSFTDTSMTTHTFDHTATTIDPLIYLFGSVANTPTNYFDNVSLRELIPPILSTATIENANPTEVVMVFNEPVTGTNLGFTVGGTTETTFASISGSGTTWTGVLATPAAFGETITVTYDDVAGDFASIEGTVDLASFTGTAVTNNVAAATTGKEKISIVMLKKLR